MFTIFINFLSEKQKAPNAQIMAKIFLKAKNTCPKVMKNKLLIYK